MGAGHKKSLLKDFQVRTIGIFRGILNSPYLGCEHYAKVNALPQA